MEKSDSPFCVVKTAHRKSENRYLQATLTAAKKTIKIRYGIETRIVTSITFL